MEKFYGKHNLINPKIRTWEDIEKLDGLIDMEINFINIKVDNILKKKALAMFKISKIIELGYGGNLSKEELENQDIKKYIIDYNHTTKHFDIIELVEMFFYTALTFKSRKDAEEFLTYPSNVELIKDYLLI